MNSKQLKWVYLIALSLIWGSSFILIKRSLLGLSALQVGSLRMIFAALFLVLLGFKSLKKIQKHHWKFIVLTALLGIFFPAYLFAIAQTQIDSSVSAILNSFTPLNTMIIGAFVFGMQFRRIQVFGILIGIIGTLLLIINGAFHHPEQNYYYAILVLLASICYAINVNLIKKYLSDLDSLSITTGNFLMMFFPAMIVLFYTGFFSQLENQNLQHALWFVVILGIIGTGIANLIFFKIIQISSPIFATQVSYLIPLVAFSWGLLDNEMLTPVQFFGGFIVLFGVYLSSRK